jgi:transcriptional regulator with XRE-family HTH domain
VGEEVARRRALLRQTQRGLARLAGVSLSAVQSVERGRHAPTTQTLEALEDALQCHVSELLPRERTTRG